MVIADRRQNHLIVASMSSDLLGTSLIKLL